MESHKLPKQYFVRSGYFKGWLVCDPRWTLNTDGSWGHNSSGQPPKLTKTILKWLQDIGWKLP